MLGESEKRKTAVSAPAPVRLSPPRAFSSLPYLLDHAASQADHVVAVSAHCDRSSLSLLLLGVARFRPLSTLLPHIPTRKEVHLDTALASHTAPSCCTCGKIAALPSTLSPTTTTLLCSSLALAPTTHHLPSPNRHPPPLRSIGDSVIILMHA